MKFFLKKYNINLIVLVIAIPAFFLSGFYSKDFMGLVGLKGTTLKDDCLTNLDFINPEPGCELFEMKLDKMQSLQEALGLQVNEYIKEGKAKRVSIFSRDLVSKRFIGVNEGDIFIMASLLKVPLAVAYYRIAETSPESLNQQVIYNGKPDLYSMQTIVPPNKLVLDHQYSVNDLLYKALVYSDNTAAEILAEHISEEYLDRTLVAIGLETIREGRKEDFVTAKSYANVFRILYNSSFLIRNYSNEILKTLSNSAFKDGATKLLPKNIVVSHKFGERTIYDKVTGKEQGKQLHDCGIVYAKDGKEPYTFCIMTEGENFTDLEFVIQNISHSIYDGLIK